MNNITALFYKPPQINAFFFRSFCQCEINCATQIVSYNKLLSLSQGSRFQ